MIILGNLLYALGVTLNGLLYFVFLALIARVVISWVNADPYNRLVQFIVAVSEPICAFVRKVLGFLPMRVGMIDLSILYAFLVVQFLRIVLADSLIEYGLWIKRSAFL